MPIPAQPQPLHITLDDGQGVSALFDAPATAPIAALTLAHGAGAGMTHAFMQDAAAGLAARGIAVLRYQFLYMEKGGKRPDAPPLAQAVVRAAVDEAARRLPGVPLFAGGKSFGGRMSSQAQAAAALPGVRGLVFFGFPLHLAGKPADTRAVHLADVQVPMLFLQGARDKLAEPDLLHPMVKNLGKRATLYVVDEADHSFHVPKRSGRTDAQVLEGLCEETLRWIKLQLG